MIQAESVCSKRPELVWSNAAPLGSPALGTTACRNHMRRLMGLIRAGKAVHWAVADQAIVSAAGFVTTIVLARQLGGEELGRFTLLWLVALIASAVQFAMIIAPMMSIAPKQPPSRQQGYFGNVLIMQCAFLLLSIAVLVVGAALGGLLPWHVDIAGNILPLTLAMAAAQLQEYGRRYLFVVDRPREAMINDLIRYGVQVALLVTLTGRPVVPAGNGWNFPVVAGAAGVLWVMAVAAAVASLAALAFSPAPRWHLQGIRESIRRHWNLSKWLAGSSILSILSANLFVVAVGSLLGAAEVGALRAVQNLLGAVGILVQGLQNVIPAQAARVFATSGTAALSVYLRRTAIATGALAVAIGVVISVAPEFWLKAFYGAEFAGYGYLMVWYSLVLLFSTFELPLSAGLRAVEATRPDFVAYLVSAAFATTTAIPVIMLLGLTGAVLGLVLAGLIRTIIMLRGLRRALHRTRADVAPAAS